MSGSSTKGISSPSRGSILDRVQPQTQSTALSESQSEVNQLVGNAISTVSDEKMMASLFTAGLAGRFIRLGTVATTGKSLVPIAVQGLSHATALAGESAVFAGTERKFAEWGGHARTQLFQKDWARAAINLGSIKLFGGVAAGQNLITQHFLVDPAMVAGHHAGYAFGVTDKPQGTLAQQMIHAEGMNLGMKGSLALLHGFSPKLSGMERSVDLALKSQEAGLFSQNQSIPFFSQPAMETAGGPEGSLTETKGNQERGSSWDPTTFIIPPRLMAAGKTEGGSRPPNECDGFSRLRVREIARSNNRFPDDFAGHLRRCELCYDLYRDYRIAFESAEDMWASMR